MTPFRRTLALLACLTLCLVAPARAAGTCPPEPRAPTAEQREAEQARARDRGMLWRVEKAGRTSWLYGTLHIGRLPWSFPGPTVRQALAGSDTLALELDPLNPETLRQLQAGVARDPRLALDPRVDRRLRVQLQKACLPAASADQLAPEILAAQLVLSANRHDGFHPEYGIDVSLAQLARTLDKPVTSLETVDLQLASLLSTNRADLNANMDRQLADLEGNRVRPLTRRLALAWEAGRAEELRDFASWCNCANTPRDRAQLKVLLDDRNPGLADTVDRLHTGGQSVFAAVGGLHLVGSEGLPALLARRGYTVTREMWAP